MKRFFVFIGLVLIGFLSRMMVHDWNVTALGAVSFLAGLYVVDKKWALLVPVFSLFLSDFILGFHSTMVFVYGALMLSAVLASLISKKPTVFKVAGFSTLSSLVFFFVTNTGVWLVENLYPKNFSGLIQSFAMGIPFYQNQFFFDIFITVAAFVCIEAVKQFESTPFFQK